MKVSSFPSCSFPVLLPLITFLLVSTLLGAAAVYRSSDETLFPFSSQQQQQQQPQRQPQSHSQSQPQGDQQQHQQQQQQPTKSQTPRPVPTEQQEYKYFHEAGWTEQLVHYDARFFRGEVPYAAHRTELEHLIRSYLSTCRALGVETWLAHGTLLGWWWNGRIMPWDFDLDVQVSGATLAELAARHNGSVHEYTYWEEQPRSDAEQQQQESDGDGAVVEVEKYKMYLLDVNPSYAEVGRRQGQNVIDARWIDLDTGMFVDITSLVEREPASQPGVWSCKNYHRYKTQDLWPLRETEFEGVPALVPFEFEKILVDEYGEKSLVVTEWEGHRWNPDLKEWVRMNKTEDAS